MSIVAASRLMDFPSTIPRRMGPVRMAGFSLVELSIVLIVVGLLTSAALEPLSLAIERSRERATQRSLDAAREALIGHFIAAGVLPCPVGLGTGANPSSPGIAAARDAGEPCRTGSGFLPNQALGLSVPMDAMGLPLDAWGNRLRYAVSLYSDTGSGRVAAPDWTSPGELAAVGLSNLQADLSLCNEPATGSCPIRALRASQIVAVIWSSGADTSATGIQGENQDNDTVFAVTGYSRADATAFDDQLLWLSRSELSYWLLRANRVE